MREIEGLFAEVRDAPVEPVMARVPELRPAVCLRLAVSRDGRALEDDCMPLVIDALRAIELANEVRKAAQVALFLSRDFNRRRQT